MNHIIVHKVYPIENGGNLKAFASVQLPDGTVIRSCRIIKEQSKRAWVSLPQIESLAPGGGKRFFTVITLPSDAHKALANAILSAWTKVSHEQI